MSMARAVTILSLVGILGLAVGHIPAATAQSGGGSEASTSAGAAKGTQKRTAKRDAKDKEASKSNGAADAALVRAQKALDAGKADVAVDQMNSLLATGGLDSGAMARAMMLRGLAYKKQGKPAQAISDLQSALWLKGALSEKDHSRAIQARAEAYREAGLGEAPPAPGQASNQTASTPPASERPVAPIQRSARAPVQPAPSANSGGGGFGDFLSGLFGSQKTTQPTASLQEAPAKGPLPAVSSWSDTEVKPAKRADTFRSKDKAEKAAKSKSKGPSAAEKTSSRSAKGNYRAQLAPVRSRAEASALAARVKKEQAGLLGGRGFEIDEATFGNMGKFYRVSIGPFASAGETQKLCSELRGKGIDCMQSTE